MTATFTAKLVPLGVLTTHGRYRVVSDKLMATDPHAAVYDRIAAQFEQLNAEMPESLVALGNQMRTRLPPSPRILDVGCGPGRDMAWFEARGASMTGIDVSTEMLARAGKRTSGTLTQMDMRHLDFPDASYDAVWAIASLLHIPKAEVLTVVSEFRRVVKEGGVVAVAVKRGAGERWVKRPDGQRFFAYYETAELESLLALAGLKAESIETAPGLDCEWLLALTQPRLTEVRAPKSPPQS
jgi:SAM-dependent methyltransferase